MVHQASGVQEAQILQRPGRDAMIIQDADAFGKAVRARRKSLGLRQSELALIAGVGVRFIVDLESGKGTCQLGKALAVAGALKISLAIQEASMQHKTERKDDFEDDEGYDLPDFSM